MLPFDNCMKLMKVLRLVILTDWVALDCKFFSHRSASLGSRHTALA
eukprot:COSAG01_NODE_1006_length_12163_cov_237.845669_10_plen_46_part_00